jgi:hypothetical protein
MTPKEKAEQLYKSMTYKCKECDYEYNAKQCALILVDEMLNDDVYDMSEEIFEMRIIYWEEVKQEIQNL